MSDQDETPISKRSRRRTAARDSGRAADPAAPRHRALPELVHAARGRARELRPADRRSHLRRQADWRVHPARRRGRRAAAGRPVPDRHGQPHPQDVQAARRQPAADRPGARARSARRGRRRASVPARAGEPGAAKSSSDDDRLEIDALLRNIKSNFQQVVSLSPLLSDDLQTLGLEHHRAGPRSPTSSPRA